MRLCGQLGLMSPLTKAYMGQIDGLNDCLVLENINKTGYVKCALSPTEKVRVKEKYFQCQSDCPPSDVSFVMWFPHKNVRTPPQENPSNYCIIDMRDV